jgi:hypothetical protein
VLETYPVEVTSLDDWLAAHEVERVDLIKIDVEGAEPAVIAGATLALGRLRPELVVEIYEGARRNFSAPVLIDAIRAFGYDAFVLWDGAPRPFQQHDDGHFNYFFKPHG